jgi:YfiH family protein
MPNRFLAATLRTHDGTQVPHGFFTRQGGVSTGPYASLNCSFSSADTLSNVTRNRAFVAQELGIDPADLIGIKQVHGTEVIDFDTPWTLNQAPRADALVLANSRFAISVITADCAPVLFTNAAGTVVAAAHAGWRGALAGILDATVKAMRQKGAGDIQAAIGPCIHQQSYEVTATLRDPILAQDSHAKTFFTPGREGRWHFDLPAYCQHRLAQVNVPAEILPHDTCADEENFFSHRRRTLRVEPAIGHQISVIKPK